MNPSENPEADPNLMYRSVEIQSWTVRHCECLLNRHWVFELCACQEPANKVMQECHSTQGVQISYKQTFVLATSNGNQTYTGGDAAGMRVGSLSQATCRPTFSEQAIKQICKIHFKIL